MSRLEIPILLVLVCALPAAAQIDDEECTACHEDAELVSEDGRSLFAIPSHLDGSPHEGLSCTDCHASIVELPHDADLPPPACEACHDDALVAYAESVHGLAVKRGDADAPTCVDCHGGGHQIRPVDDPLSTVYPTRQIVTCARCHADPKVVQRHAFSVDAPVDAYRQSAHFRALAERGVGAAPSCSDCHGNHDLKPARDPASPIHWTRIPETCGRCHKGIQDVFEVSVHGKAVRAGVRQAPVCTDCHGEHEIRGPSDPESTVYPTHISKTTCVWCHESLRLVKKYDLPGSRLQSYLDSYHGLADRAGSKAVANCASCHGIHNILPSADPASTINPTNLPETCGKCHPGVGENVSFGQIHIAAGEEQDKSLAVYYVREFYILLIIVSVGGMLVHNGLDFARKFRADRVPDGNEFLRFTVAERLQHATLAISFIVLAYSGFALKFPDAWWASPLAWWGAGEMGRRWVHRVAALSMVGVCVYHIGYVLLSRRGWKQLGEMRPRIQDMRDAVKMIRYLVGSTPHHPAFGRFSYIEKLEYWALVWGSVVMTATGFALWFENQTLQMIPKWGLDIATLIHYYEAWLAMLAILVWHFYWVIFNPRVYPMSLVWLTGRLSREAMEEEHPRELSELEGDGDVS